MSYLNGSLAVQWSALESSLGAACGKDRLPPSHLTLAVEQAIAEGGWKGEDRRQALLETIQGRLSREDPMEVARVFNRMVEGRLCPRRQFGRGRSGSGAASRALRRPSLWRDKHGLTLRELAEVAGLERGTLAAMMEHHGYLEIAPYGGTQRRRLVTDQAFHAGLGHNCDGSHRRIAHLEGMAMAVVFPVFYPERVADILWSLDYEGIAARAVAIKGKRDRMRWLLDHHGYLPDAELAKLAGYSLSGAEKARATRRETQRHG